MYDTILNNIIVKVLVLVEEILDVFVNAPTYNEGNILNCTPASFTAGTITDCGAALVAQIGTLAVQGVGFLSGMLVALGA